MSSSWFQFDPNRAPDADFEPGELHHLCVGNEGRLLDFRRTPVRVIRLCDETGLATVEILAFEDKGALWDLPYEEVSKYQFKGGSPKASVEALGRIEREAARLNRQVEISCEATQREETLAAISHERERARAWLGLHSQLFQSEQTLPQGEAKGSPLLYADTKDYMAQRGLGDLEALFTRHYVSHLFNETVKAHRVAVAQLGLAPYVGKILTIPLKQQVNCASNGEPPTSLPAWASFKRCLSELGRAMSCCIAWNPVKGRCRGGAQRRLRSSPRHCAWTSCRRCRDGRTRSGRSRSTAKRFLSSVS